MRCAVLVIVILSVSPSVTPVDCIHVVRSTIMVFTLRRYALHGLSYRNSGRPSVSLSVRLSVTLVHCVHVVRPTIMISSTYDSPIILVSGDITLIPQFEWGHPERGL